MVVVPEMIGSIVGVYNGKTYNQVEIKVTELAIYWHNPVVRPSVHLSVCDAVHCGSQGWYTSFCSYNSACINIFIHRSRRCDHNE